MDEISKAIYRASGVLTAESEMRMLAERRFENGQISRATMREFDRVSDHLKDVAVRTRDDIKGQAGLKVDHITFEFFSLANRARCESPNGFNQKLSDWTMSDWMTATMGELGEAANIVKKLNRYRDGIPGNKETEEALKAKLKKELGDVFVYLDLMCQAAGVNLIEAAVEVFNDKSDDIGYPVFI